MFCSVISHQMRTQTRQKLIVSVFLSYLSKSKPRLLAYYAKKIESGVPKHFYFFTKECTF